MEPQTIKISIIVPVYNTEKYLHKCVDSILAQTFPDFEILLVNDGSTDSSRQICESYANKDSRIKVFNKENEGVSSARNVGIENAKGEWITFVDSDDWINERTLEVAIKQAMCNDADICCYDFRVIDKDKEVCVHTPVMCEDKQENIKNWLRFELTSLWCMVAKKELYEVYHLRCPVWNYCEDFHLTTRLFYYAKKITQVNYCGYNYNRLNLNSILNSKNKKASESELCIYRDVVSFFSANQVLQYYEEEIAWRILKCTQDLILNDSSHKCFISSFPPRYRKYIFTCPSKFVNYKLKIMAWLLCCGMGVLVRLINSLRVLLVHNRDRSDDILSADTMNF